MNKARAEAAGDALATQRVEWLAKGLTHAELILAVEKAYEQGIDTGDKGPFAKAYQALADFRAKNAEYDKTNFAGLSGDEKLWARLRQ